MKAIHHNDYMKEPIRLDNDCYSDFERFLYRLYENIRNLVMLNFVVVVIKNNGKNKDCSM